MENVYYVRFFFFFLVEKNDIIKALSSEIVI